MCRSMHLYPFLLILPVISITEEWGGDDEERSRRGEKKGKQSAQRERKWKEAVKGGRREREEKRNWGVEVETEKKLILSDLHLNHSHSCHGDADSSSSRCLTFLWPLPSNQGRTGEWDPQKREERGRGNPSLLQSSGGEMERSYTKKDVKKFRAKQE